MASEKTDAKPDLRADDPQVICRPMTLKDLPQVEALDRESFPTPWPEGTYFYELTRNPHALCWVAEVPSQDGNPLIAGAIVSWVVADEAHLATLAVKTEHRRLGIAQKLLTRSLLICHQRGATLAMLEVRESNLPAQSLYKKFGFEVVGRRKDYYKDRHEDAILMTLTRLDPVKLAALAEPG